MAGWHTWWLSLLVIEARRGVDLQVLSGSLKSWWTARWISGLRDRCSVAVPPLSHKAWLFCTWMRTLRKDRPFIRTQLVPSRSPPSTGGSVTIATRLGRKWLRRPTLTSQVTLQTSTRDSKSQARALPNQDAVPVSPTTDSALEQ